MPEPLGAIRIATFIWGIALATTAGAGRFEAFTEKATRGPKMTVAAATFFGGESIEEFVAAGELPDGSIVAFGNAWGPQFVSPRPPLVLARGAHRGLDPYLPQPRQKQRELRQDDPDAAGMIVFFAPKLAGVNKVVRFDWGVASFSTGVVLPGGRGLLVAGRCTDSFKKTVRTHSRFEPVSGETSSSGPCAYGNGIISGDVFIALLPPSGDGVLWTVIFQSPRTPPDHLWLDYQGNSYADVHGLVRIAPDGQSVTRIDTVVESSDGASQRRTLTAGRATHYMAIDPDDGAFYYGGDRSTNTGFQWWRQPYLYKFDPDGRRAWKLWDWPAKLCGSGGDGNGLCANSSIRAMDIASDGNLVVAGWSAGANSVVTRQPADLDQPVRLNGFGMDAAGMKDAVSVGYLLKIDPKSRRLVDGTLFQAYQPTNARDRRQRGAPSSTRLREVVVTSDGSIAFTGTAGAGLVQTPGAFYQYPKDGTSYSGEFAAVFDGGFQNLLFSSYLPGCEHAHVTAVRDGVLIVSRAKGADDLARPSPAPAINAIQSQQRGDYDAHIILLTPPHPAAADAK